MKQQQVDLMRQVAICYVSTNSTIREVAKIMHISKSSVHKKLNDFLLLEHQSGYYTQLAHKVRKLIEQNKQEKHIRGGIATKNKFLKSKE